MKRMISAVATAALLLSLSACERNPRNDASGVSRSAQPGQDESARGRMNNNGTDTTGSSTSGSAASGRGSQGGTTTDQTRP